MDIFVVSTEARKFSVLKYLSSVSAPGCVSVNIKNMGKSPNARGLAAVKDTDIVLFYNGSHYNALTWLSSPELHWDEEDALVEAHFYDQYGDD